MTPVSAGIVPCGRACILVFGDRDRGGRATGTQHLFEPFLDHRVMKGHFEQLRCGHLLLDRPSQKVAQMLARRGNQVRADQHMVEDRFALALAASAHAYILLAGFGHGIDTQVQIDIAFDDCLGALWTRGQRSLAMV